MHVWIHALHERWYLHHLTPTKLVHSGDHVLHPSSAQRNSIIDETISPAARNHDFPSMLVLLTV